MSNIDHILTAQMQEPVANSPSNDATASTPPQDSPTPDPVDVEHSPEPESDGDETYIPASKQTQPETEAKAEEAAPEPKLDEYGNEVAPTRMYSEEEVQRMIRDRLSRGQHTQPATQQAVQQAAQDFTADPNSELTWQEQLDAYIDRRLDTREEKQTRAQWEATERQIQADFEAKFNTGMGKYKDFMEVVGAQPITDSMMLAARSLENPAAFIYAAAKFQGKELQRIAQIRDPYIQATEIGKLEERMKRSPKVSNTPKPIT